MYPSTTFIIEDRSHIEDLQLTEQYPSPVFAQFFTSDKGPEEMGEYFGDEFKIFGTPNFARHGQPLLQAQRLINNGATVLAKRVVAPDATLANLIVLAKVKSSSVQKTNAQGQALYSNAAGKETTKTGDDEGNTYTPIMINSVEINYELRTVEGNLNDMAELKASALTLASYEGKAAEDEKVYPICLVADNGRGVSSKKISITANVTGSRNKNFMSYIFSVIEGTEILESTVFTLNPETVSSTSNLALRAVAKTYLKEVRVESFDEVMTAFINDIKSATNIEDIDNVDILFGKDKRGNTLMDADGNPIFKIGENVNLEAKVNSVLVGNPLQSGSNGSFGITPMKSEDYVKELANAFNPSSNEDICDLDNILLDAIIDANYPDDVKKAIETLIEFREDAVFFRDLGVGLYTTEDIIDKAEQAAKSRYIGIYGNFYDVIDEYSKKQITVTAGYTLAKLLPDHLANNRHAPVAGSLHGFIFDEIVEGTLNIMPKKIPGKDQKEELFNHKINFISYLDKVPVLESEYTTQIDHTGFSYINNTLAVQRVIKAIRVGCPKNRYSFMEEEDLIRYEEDVQRILDKYASNFTSLKMEYAADPTYEQNMVYYALLYVKFKKFVQAEVFRIIAINNDDVVAAI